MFLLSVKMTSCSILEMQRCKWPETLRPFLLLPRCPAANPNEHGSPAVTS